MCVCVEFEPFSIGVEFSGVELSPTSKTHKGENNVRSITFFSQQVLHLLQKTEKE